MNNMLFIICDVMCVSVCVCTNRYIGTGTTKYNTVFSSSIKFNLINIFHNNNTEA